MPGRLLRHNRVEFAVVMAYVLAVAIVGLSSTANGEVAMFGKAAGQANPAAPPDLASIVGLVLSNGTDFIAAFSLLLIAGAILYHRRRTTVAVGEKRDPSGPPFLF